MGRRTRKRWWLVAVVVGVLALTASTAPASGPTLAAAGDIACGASAPPPSPPEGCEQQATADVITTLQPDALTPLGDNQYQNATSEDFSVGYGPSWGAFKSIVHPVPGNHEYKDPAGGASGYFTYFGSSAGDPSKGYYSYDLGTWHIIALNANCASLNDCGPPSAEEQWLRDDLAAHPALCTLAYWHQPLFTDGESHPDDFGSATSSAFLTTLWQDLYDAQAEVILNGHDHNYQRWAQQKPDGTADPTDGVVEFVVGTGGRSHHTVLTSSTNDVARNDDTFGVLLLTLEPGSYLWRFYPAGDGTFTDSGSAPCHGEVPPSPQPTPPSPSAPPLPSAPPAQSPPPSPSAPPMALFGKARLGLLGRSVTISLKTGRGKTRSRCDNLGTDHCAVTLTLMGSPAARKGSASRKRVKLGTAKGTIAGGKTGVVNFTLTHRGLAALRKARRHRLKVTARGRSSNRLGQATAVRKTMTLQWHRRTDQARANVDRGRVPR